MILLRAKFENFRLLRDLELKFATDRGRPVTVIRAANESGKTTVLTALQWALYGDDVLPGNSATFRIHPIDWADDGESVPISVTVDLETVRHKKVGHRLSEERIRYRLVRSTSETLRGTTWDRPRSQAHLFQLNETGAQPIANPDSIIREEIPLDLREVFFTDGDRALSFIEADASVSTKRQRVQEAIRSLLGLGVIEAAQQHVEKARAEVNRRVKELVDEEEVSKLSSEVEALDKRIADLAAERKDADEQIRSIEDQILHYDKLITAALKKGDRETLARDLESTSKELKKARERQIEAQRNHAKLFRGSHVARALLANALGKAFAALDQLHDQGQIPSTTLPVLEERLKLGVCICGETLSDMEAAGRHRREHIAKLIDDSRRSDEQKNIVTELFYGSRDFLGDLDGGSWKDAYGQVFKQLDDLMRQIEETERKQKALEAQVESLDDTDVQGLRRARRDFHDQKDRFIEKKTSAHTHLDHFIRQKAEAETRLDKLVKQHQSGARFLADKTVVQDVSAVLQRAYDSITTEELRKVSDTMNRLFVEMIGADEAQHAIIKRAEISAQYDIIVHGKNGRTLDPDRDLNGASRRALTIAFILALTEVSEVAAPNVIDTPLGMMSGYVKESVLRIAAKHSSQLILLLTHSEIQGCESILDEAAGSVMTLTNPAHYPRMLVNDPGIEDARVLLCGCNHRKSCTICERKSLGAAV